MRVDIHAPSRSRASPSKLKSRWASSTPTSPRRSAPRRLSSAPRSAASPISSTSSAGAREQGPRQGAGRGRAQGREPARRAGRAPPQPREVFPRAPGGVNRGAAGRDAGGAGAADGPLGASRCGHCSGRSAWHRPAARSVALLRHGPRSTPWRCSRRLRTTTVRKTVQHLCNGGHRRHCHQASRAGSPAPAARSAADIAGDDSGAVPADGLFGAPVGRVDGRVPENTNTAANSVSRWTAKPSAASPIAGTTTKLICCSPTSRRRRARD